MSNTLKVFVSVPMRGRDDSAIADSIAFLKRVATTLWATREVEFVDNFMDYKPSNDLPHPELMYLGDAVKKMAECDAFIGVDISDRLYPGCAVEQYVAELYDLDQCNLDPSEYAVFQDILGYAD